MYWYGFLLILVSIYLVDLGNAECATTERHRRPWHQTGNVDRELYANGMKELYLNGKLETFVLQHADTDSNRQAHYNSAFFPWHRLLIWELETAIRDLGGDYECFALPYWDWTWEIQGLETYNCEDFFILTNSESGLGGVGTSENNWCVQEGKFGVASVLEEGDERYETQNCAGTDDTYPCCLTRGNCGVSNSWSCTFKTAEEMFEAIIDEDNLEYGDDDSKRGQTGIRSWMELIPHAYAHIWIASGGHLTNLAYSPDDPIFFLVHCFIDYMWALWQDCHDADTYDKADIGVYSEDPDIEDTSWIYDGTLAVVTSKRGPSTINTDLSVTILAAEDWSSMYSKDPAWTIRDMHNIQDFDVTYEKGDFWTNGGVQEAEESGVTCNFNGVWFTEVAVSPDPAAVGPPQKTPQQQFRANAFGLLRSEMGDRAKTVQGERELYRTMASMACEFNQLAAGHICKRPQNFDDCSDMDIDDDTDDIVITLEELQNKRGLSDCMKSNREAFFDWADQTGTKLNLCAGGYDNFCDIQEESQDGVQDVCDIIRDAQCPAKQGQGKGIYGDEEEGVPPYSPPEEKGGPTPKYKGAQVISIRDQIDGFDESTFSQLSDFHKFVVSAFVGGAFTLFLILICLSVRHCYFQQRNAGYAIAPTKAVFMDDETDDEEQQHMMNQ